MAASAEVLPLPGDPAPALVVGEWLQRGRYDAVRPVEGRLLTVLIFCATWDPLARHLLPQYDARQAELAAQGVRVLALALDDPEEVRAYLQQAGLNALAVACDAEGRALECYTGRYESAPLPFAVLVREGRTPRIIWQGPLTASTTSSLNWYFGYGSDFAEALGEAVAGRPPAPARREEKARRRLCALLEHVNAAGGDLRRVGELTRRVRAVPVAETHRPLASTLLAFAAAALMTAEGATARRRARGQALAAQAMELDGGHGPFAPYARARSLFLAGDARRALELQAEANGRLRRAGLWTPEFGTATEEYARAAGEETQASTTVEEAPPLTSVTAAEAEADLVALRDHLRERYVGWEDTRWWLAGGGSSWEARTADYVQRIHARAGWCVPDFFELLLDYLSVLRDRHLRLNGDAGAMGGRPARVSPTPSTAVYFTDTCVREVGGRLTLEAAAWAGAEVVGVPVVPDARHAEYGRPYLFPALPEGTGRRYLLGVLQAEGREAEPITVTARREGREQEITLPVHRGRSARQVADWQAWNEGPACSLQMEPYPVVEVRRMWGDGVEDIPGTADRVREQPWVILDLRANGGGDDTWSAQWCARFTSQEVRISRGFCTFHPEEKEPAARWATMRSGACTARSRGLLAMRAPEQYRGRLAVLLDSGVGSAAECLVAMACQMDGALLVGENSGGCMTYGNADQLWRLPNSRLWITYPRNKDALAGRPFREGRGFFPDYWLDTADPVGAIVEYLKLAATRR